MTVESEILTRLNAYSPLTTLAGQRVYASQAPQNVSAPFVVFHKIGASRESAFSADTGDVRYMFQFDCYGTTYESAVGVVNALRAALQRYENGNIHHVFVGSEKSMYNDEGELYRQMIEFTVWYKET
jgi:hypothetical protein